MRAPWRRGSPHPVRTERIWAAGAEVVGFLLYELDGDVVTLIHTEVDPRAEGTGVGSALARHALDDARAAGRHVVPVCPFVSAWLRRHPDYADLVHQG